MEYFFYLNKFGKEEKLKKQAKFSIKLLLDMIILYILTNCVPNMTVTYLLIYKVHMVFSSLKMRKLSLTSQA